MKITRTVVLAVCLAILGSVGAWAQVNTSNTAYGQNVLNGGNTTPWGWDTAVGSDALSVDSTGIYNTAIGSYALADTTTGSYNTASGNGALWNNTTGWYNTADGAYSLQDNTTGVYNTASGYLSLLDNTTGGYNAANGTWSLRSNTTGSYNTADGTISLYHNTTGNYNIASGVWSLAGNTTGSYNIGIGDDAGLYNPAGASNNIDIGSYGSASDTSPTIRIGNPFFQSAFYAAGINGTAISGPVPVYINSNGQLGTVNSSIRFKEDVHDMAAASDGLMRLRPVTYRYKQAYADGSKPIDYGLIAEEVAQVYPDMVVKGADGQIQTVQYQKLTPMLLNEVQKEHKQLEEQAATIQQLKAQLAALPLLEKRLAALEAVQPASTMLETRLVTK